MIDWARIRELQSEIGADDFLDIVDVFMEEVETAVATLPKADKGEGLEALLHLIKGCALNLGFDALGQLCAEGEAAAAAGNGAAVDTNAVSASFFAAKAVFDEELPRYLAAGAA